MWNMMAVFVVPLVAIEPPKTLNLCPVTAELVETMLVATTTCAGIQQWSTKSNATTQERCTQETHNKRSKLECNNTSKS